MSQTVAEDILFGTLLTAIIVMLSSLVVVSFAIAYEIHPLLPVAIAVVWVTTVGYLVQTNSHNNVDLLWWFK